MVNASGLSFLAPCLNENIVTQQLNDGIRMLQLQVHNSSGTLQLCHSSCVSDASHHFDILHLKASSAPIQWRHIGVLSRQRYDAFIRALRNLFLCSSSQNMDGLEHQRWYAPKDY